MHVESNSCLLTLFGNYHPLLQKVHAEREADLYSAFVSKASSLGWKSTYSDTSSPSLWGMEDAELEYEQVVDDAVAWVRVGLMDPAQPPHMAGGPLLPMALCAWEAVRDFGDLELNAIQFMFPLAAIKSESVSVESLETWLYPTPAAYSQPLGLTVSIDSGTAISQAEEAEAVLSSPVLQGIFSSIASDSTGRSFDNDRIVSEENENSSSRTLLRATAEISRWGAVQGACAATAIALALSQTGAEGSVTIRIEGRPR